MIYTIRLLFQNQDESKNWMIELQSTDDILPTVDSHLAFKILNKYTMFEVSMVIFYPGSEMQPVVVTKPSKIPDDDLILEIVENIKSSCNDQKLVFRQIKDLVSKVS